MLAAVCVTALLALPASAIELTVSNGTDQNMDVLVDGAKLCSLRHRISVRGANGWQDSGVYGFRGAKKTCVVESKLSCCCNEDSDDLF
jgi:hypothetical protein